MVLPSLTQLLRDVLPQVFIFVIAPVVVTLWRLPTLIRELVSHRRHSPRFDHVTAPSLTRAHVASALPADQDVVRLYAPSEQVVDRCGPRDVHETPTRRFTDALVH
jgi:hypothetical protein